MVIHTVSARESLYYTWDDSQGKKAIKWNFPAAKVHHRKPVNVTQVSTAQSGAYIHCGKGLLVFDQKLDLPSINLWNMSHCHTVVFDLLHEQLCIVMLCYTTLLL